MKKMLFAVAMVIAFASCTSKTTETPIESVDSVAVDSTVVEVIEVDTVVETEQVDSVVAE